MHPNIDITSQPGDCIQPVYNCIKFCFLANDYIRSAGTKADFEIQFTSDINQAAGLPFIISGFDFLTDPTNGFDTFDWSGTLTEIADKLFDTL